MSFNVAFSSNEFDCNNTIESSSFVDFIIIIEAFVITYKYFSSMTLIDIVTIVFWLTNGNLIETHINSTLFSKIFSIFVMIV